MKRLLYSKRVFALLDPLGCGWLDGGCWTLAEGLKLWLGDAVDLYCAFDFCGAPQHVMVRVGDQDIYIDGDGITTAYGMTVKLVEEEMVDGPVSLQPLPRDFQLGKHGIVRLDSVPPALATSLRRRFGDGGLWLDRVQKEAEGADLSGTLVPGVSL